MQTANCKLVSEQETGGSDTALFFWFVHLGVFLFFRSSHNCGSIVTISDPFVSRDKYETRRNY